jgi:hypothetical protein
VSTELPKWATEEIDSITDASFKFLDTYEGTGYFLDMDEKNRKADIQFYEKLPVGKHIVTVEVPKSIKMDSLMKGFVYTYKVKILRAPLSEKLIKYLAENLNMNIKGVDRFELESCEMLEDVEADLKPIAEDDSED